MAGGASRQSLRARRAPRHPHSCAPTSLFLQTHWWTQLMYGQSPKPKRRRKRTLGRLLFIHGLGSRVEGSHPRDRSSGRWFRHQETGDIGGNKGTPTHKTQGDDTSTQYNRQPTTALRSHFRPKKKSKRKKENILLSRSTHPSQLA